MIPAQRGSITDAHGTDLAVSEPRPDIAATPYLIDDATRRRAARAADRRPRGRAAAQARKPHELRLPRARLPAAKADLAAKLEDRGHRVHPALQARLPARLVGLAAARLDRHRRAGPRRARVPLRQAAARRRRRAPDGQGREGQPDRDARHRARRPGQDVKLTLDANLQDRTEEVLNEVGRVWQPMGATAIVMDPNSGAILALANWPRVNANALQKAPDYARRTARSGPSTSPARRSRR